MVDHLNDMATEILMEFIHRATCPTARLRLRNSPEVLAVKAFEKAINDIYETFRRPDARMN